MAKRNRKVMDTMSLAAGTSKKAIQVQASKLLDTFDEKELQEMLHRVGIKPVIEADLMNAFRLQTNTTWNQLRIVSGLALPIHLVLTCFDSNTCTNT